MTKLVIATVASVISLPFLAIGIGLLFVVLWSGRPLPWLDGMVDRIIDGPSLKRPAAAPG